MECTIDDTSPNWRWVQDVVGLAGKRAETNEVLNPPPRPPPPVAAIVDDGDLYSSPYALASTSPATPFPPFPWSPLTLTYPWSYTPPPPTAVNTNDD